MDLQNLILESKKDNVWTVGNKFLYHLFSENLSHTDPSGIVAKVWILGRTYSASIERHKNKEIPEATNFFEDIVPGLFQSFNEGGSFDNKITALRALREEQDMMLREEK